MRQNRYQRGVEREAMVLASQRKGLKVIVCGGREFKDDGMMAEVIRTLVRRGMTELVHGNAPGADQMAGNLTRFMFPDLTITPVDADWRRFKLSAGSIRNGWMLELKPDLVVALPGGDGTANMIKQAKAAKVHTVVFDENYVVTEFRFNVD